MQIKCLPRQESFKEKKQRASLREDFLSIIQHSTRFGGNDAWLRGFLELVAVGAEEDTFETVEASLHIGPPAVFDAFHFFHSFHDLLQRNTLTQ